jgi:hypothetical protein
MEGPHATKNMASDSLEKDLAGTNTLAYLGLPSVTKINVL